MEAQVKTKPTTDDTLVNLMYFYINGAYTIVDFVDTFDRYLLRESIDKDQKKALKTEMGFTSKAIHLLGLAQEEFRKFNSILGQLSEEVEGILEPAMYDLRNESNRELICHDIAYIYKSYGDPDAEKAFKEHDLSYGELDHEHQLLYDHFAKEL